MSRIRYCQDYVASLLAFLVLTALILAMLIAPIVKSDMAMWLRIVLPILGIMLFLIKAGDFITAFRVFGRDLWSLARALKKLGKAFGLPGRL